MLSHTTKEYRKTIAPLLYEPAIHIPCAATALEISRVTKGLLLTEQQMGTVRHQTDRKKTLTFSKAGRNFKDNRKKGRI